MQSPHAVKAAPPIEIHARANGMGMGGEIVNTPSLLPRRLPAGWAVTQLPDVVALARRLLPPEVAIQPRPPASTWGL